MFLHTQFFCLSFLPRHILEGVHFVSCRHIATIMREKLLQAKKYNLIALYNLNFDLQAMEEFARSTDVADLVETFSELRQFLNLMLSGNIEQILDKPTRDNKFPALQPERLIPMLQRYRDISLRGRVPDDLVKIKRKTVESVVKGL